MTRFPSLAAAGAALLLLVPASTVATDIQSMTDAQILQKFCPAERKSNKRGNKDRELNVVYWDKLPERVSPQAYNEIAKTTLQAGENSVYELTFVERDELRHSLDEARKVVLDQIRRHPDPFMGPSGDDRILLRKITERLESVQLQYGRSFVYAYENYLGTLEENESKSWHVLRSRAYRRLHEVCGGNGLTVQHAMFIPPFPGFDEGGILLCPGLVLSMSDIDSRKEVILAATAFHFAGVLGNIIRDEVKPAWDIALEKGDITSAQAVERLRPHQRFLNPNFWSSMALASRMEEQDMQTRTVTTILALDADCLSRKTAEREDAERRILEALTQPSLAYALGQN